MPYRPPGNWDFTIQNVLRQAPVLGRAEFLNQNSQLYAQARNQVGAEAHFQNPDAGLNQARAVVVLPTVYHFIIIGQSNGTGGGALPLYMDGHASALMFAGGLKPGTSGLTSFVPLAEMTGTDGQTVASSIANWLAARLYAPESRKFLFSNVSVSNTGYNGLKKGTGPYQDSLDQVIAARDLCASLGYEYEVAGLVCIHGEFDDQFQRAAYRTELVQWQTDYDADIQAIHAQAKPVKLYAAAQYGYTPEAYNSASPTLAGSSSLNVLGAMLDAPDRIVYFMQQNRFELYDGIHMNAVSQCLLGEKFAEALKAVYFDEGDAFPLYPTAVNRTGASIVIDFNVPVGPIKFDYAHSGFKKFKGFTYVDDDDSEDIQSVAITGPAQITVTLTGTPTGANPQIRYQCSQFSGQGNNNKFSRAGNITDSSTGDSIIGLPFANHGVSFLLPV